MRGRKHLPTRVHLISPANPVGKDVEQFGFGGIDAYVAAIRAALPAPYRLTFDPRLMHAVEDQNFGGRRDDALRIRDLQTAIDDPQTRAIVASSGGAYLSRILPHVDFSALARRRAPLWLFGFSELTNLVNVFGSYRCGRGVYWLCPNYLAWRVRSRVQARAAFAEFWGTLPQFWERDEPGPRRHDRGSAAGHVPGAVPFRERGKGGVQHAREELAALVHEPITLRVERGRPRSAVVRVLGGCLSVLTAMLAGPLAKRLDPRGRWLLIEDINEQPYRIDRHLAALKLAGWFGRLAGVIVADFHTRGENQSAAALELLPYHLPAGRPAPLPVLATTEVGHVWPMKPMPINQPLRLVVRGRAAKLSQV